MHLLRLLPCLLLAAPLLAQQPERSGPAGPGQKQYDNNCFVCHGADGAPSIFPYESRSPVSLIKGDDRRKNITEALLAMDKEIGPAIKRKKYVVIKVNNVATNNQLAATHADALRGILEYLAPRFAAVIDGFEGTEGNRPSGVTAVPMHVAIASPDFMAADRVALEIMVIPQHAVGCLQYAAQRGVGQFDLSKIDIRKPDTVKRVFKLHYGVQRQWDGLKDIMRQG